MSSRPWEISRSPIFYPGPLFPYSYIWLFHALHSQIRSMPALFRHKENGSYFFLNAIPVLYIIEVNICWKYAKMLSLSWCFFLKPLKMSSSPLAAIRPESRVMGASVFIRYVTQNQKWDAVVSASVCHRGMTLDFLINSDKSLTVRRRSTYVTKDKQGLHVSAWTLRFWPEGVKLLTTLVFGGSWFSR